MSVSEQWFERDPLWFKHAVFYEIHIRGFFDGNEEGSGEATDDSEKAAHCGWCGRGAAERG